MTEVEGTTEAEQEARRQRFALEMRAVASAVLARRDESSPLAVQAALMLDSLSGMAAQGVALPALQGPAHHLAEALTEHQAATVPEESAELAVAERPEKRASLMDEFERLTEFRLSYPTGDELSFMDACTLRLAEQVTAALDDAPRPYRLDVLREALLGQQLLQRTLGQRAGAIALQLYSWTVVPAAQPGALRHDQADVVEVAGDNAHLVHQTTVGLQERAERLAELMDQAGQIVAGAVAELAHLSHRPERS